MWTDPEWGGEDDAPDKDQSQSQGQGQGQGQEHPGDTHSRLARKQPPYEAP